MAVINHIHRLKTLTFSMAQSFEGAKVVKISDISCPVLKKMQKIMNF